MLPVYLWTLLTVQRLVCNVLYVCCRYVMYWRVWNWSTGERRTGAGVMINWAQRHRLTTSALSSTNTWSRKKPFSRYTLLSHTQIQTPATEAHQLSHQFVLFIFKKKCIYSKKLKNCHMWPHVCQFKWVNAWKKIPFERKKPWTKLLACLTMSLTILHQHS